MLIRQAPGVPEIDLAEVQSSVSLRAVRDVDRLRGAGDQKRTVVPDVIEDRLKRISVRLRRARVIAT